jgi:hypothetical protein
LKLLPPELINLFDASSNGLFGYLLKGDFDEFKLDLDLLKT